MDRSETEKQWIEKQREENNKVKMTTCNLCEKTLQLNEVYSLQTCGHIICYPCIFDFLKTTLDGPFFSLFLFYLQ